MSHKRVGQPRSECRAAILGAVIAVSGAVLVLIAPGLKAQSSLQDAGSTESLPPGPMQQKATTTCTECHEARIILQQRLSKAAWTKEVDKMTKWGALVEAADRDALIEYFSSNFSPDRAPYDPPRSSRTKGH